MGWLEGCEKEGNEEGLRRRGRGTLPQVKGMQQQPKGPAGRRAGRAGAAAEHWERDGGTERPRLLRGRSRGSEAWPAPHHGSALGLFTHR